MTDRVGFFFVLDWFDALLIQTENASHYGIDWSLTLAGSQHNKFLASIWMFSCKNHQLTCDSFTQRLNWMIWRPEIPFRVRPSIILRLLFSDLPEACSHIAQCLTQLVALLSSRLQVNICWWNPTLNSYRVVKIEAIQSRHTRMKLFLGFPNALFSMLCVIYICTLWLERLMPLSLSSKEFN